MILAAAFCPHPPLLVPQLAQGAAAELDEARDAAIAAIRAAAHAPGPGTRPRLLVLGGGDKSRIHSPLARGSFAQYGVDVEVHLGSPSCGGALELPLSLSVGAWLIAAALGPLNGAMGVSIGADFRSSRAAADLVGLLEGGDWVLVVMGDGSARRFEGSPGSADADAVPFDDAVARALAAGDADALGALDEPTASRLLCAGAPAWAVAGDLLGDARWDARLGYAGAPYGVAYFVAAWRRAAGSAGGSAGR